MILKNYLPHWNWMIEYTPWLVLRKIMSFYIAFLKQFVTSYICYYNGGQNETLRGIEKLFFSSKLNDEIDHHN